MSPMHVAQALLVVLIWGVNFVVIRWGLNEVPPFLLACARFTLVAFPAIFLIRKPNIPWRWLIAYGLFNSFGQFAFLFWAMKVGMPASLASVVHQSQVFFTLIFSVLVLGLKPRWAQWLGLLIAVMGLLLIVYGKGVGVTQMTSLGLVLNLLGAACWAAGNITVAMMRRAGLEVDPFGLVIWSSLVPILPFAVLSWTMEGAQISAIRSIGWQSVVAVLYLAIAATIIGYGLWSRLLHQYEPNRIAPFSLLVPVIGLVTAWLVLGERLNVWQMMGSLGLLLGLVINLWGARGWNWFLARIRP